MGMMGVPVELSLWNEAPRHARISQGYDVRLVILLARDEFNDNLVAVEVEFVDPVADFWPKLEDC